MIDIYNDQAVEDLNETNLTIVNDGNDQMCHLDMSDDYSYNNKTSITWRNLNVTVPNQTKCFDKLRKKEKTYDVNATIKPLINNIDGIAQANQVLAIMGSSGAGKTTLLNALNFRNRGNLRVEGEIRVNGRLIKSVDDITGLSGYVQQDDLFVGCLTVKEHLLFQAMLRMGRDYTYKEKLARVYEVMRELNLEKCQDIIIGIFGMKGISGGEKKRLSFASEIITNPMILFCDEPTSGLDSFMAVSIIESMKQLAKRGKTIICTIHQPSSEIYELFDQLCLLAEGRLAYLGDLSNAIEFFNSQGFFVPPNYNPADFFIKKLAITPSNREDCLNTVLTICDGFKKSDLKKAIDVQINLAENRRSNSSLVSKNQSNNLV